MNKILNSSLYFVLFVALLACGGDKPQKRQVSSSEKKEVPQNPMKKKIEEMKEIEKEAQKKMESDDKVEEQTEPSMTPEQLKKAKDIIKGVSKKDLEGLDGKKLFRINCATCHGFKGNMKVNGAKDLTKSKLPLHEAVAQVYFGKGLMTPYKSILKEEEIVAVSKFAETLRK